MTKALIQPGGHSQDELKILFQRADEQWEAGNLRSAFRLFLAAAEGGEPGCQVNIGTFYSEGLGVKKDIPSALYWYRRAYRRGIASAANNIGCVYRDEG